MAGLRDAQCGLGEQGQGKTRSRDPVLAEHKLAPWKVLEYFTNMQQKSQKSMASQKERLVGLGTAV